MDCVLVVIETLIWSSLTETQDIPNKHPNSARLVNKVVLSINRPVRKLLDSLSLFGSYLDEPFSMKQSKELVTLSEMFVSVQSVVISREHRCDWVKPLQSRKTTPYMKFVIRTTIFFGCSGRQV